MNGPKSRLKSGRRERTLVASYHSRVVAATAVRRILADGLTIERVSIIARDSETTEEAGGSQTPAPSALEDARQSVPISEIFGEAPVKSRAFILPSVGGVVAVGPLANYIAGAIDGTVGDALVNALGAIEVPRDQALKCQDRLKAGELLLAFRGTPAETARAHYLLRGTAHTHLRAYSE